MTSDDGSLDPTKPRRQPSQEVPTGTAPTGAHASAPPLQARGYQIGQRIGRGGMGEVLLAHDPSMGRDVAIKRMLAADPSDVATARFLREARIQARLDHPAIVPVHELGFDDEGRPYFTMKRLSGETLLALLGTGQAHAQRLLRAFVEVCLAIDLAHAKGIVHRDLKPANIMLGDYGEVYVLDWGVARVIEPAAEGDPVIPSVERTTRADEILGTPGYMPPEQILGEPVGPPADVYALGCILFEILAGQPVHPRGHGALVAALESTDVSPAARCPERGIAPELDAACVGALARNPNARLSVRALADQVQRYLDGDRDLEQRRRLAATQLERATTALAEADRAGAMRAAGRALALDPASAEAAQLVTKLMLEPPPEPPEALRVELAQAAASSVRRHARATVWSFLSIFLFIPAFLWDGVRSWRLVLALLALALVLAGAAAQFVRRPERTRREMIAYVIGNAVMIAMLGRLFGPLILTPVVACMIIMSVIRYPVFGGRPWLPFGITMAGWLAPVALERAGLLAPTWTIANGAIVSTSDVVGVGGAATVVLVCGAAAAIVAIAGIHAGAVARANMRAQQALVTQAWHLRQLLPNRR